jgi:hypothetical protein
MFRGAHAVVTSTAATAAAAAAASCACAASSASATSTAASHEPRRLVRPLAVDMRLPPAQLRALCVPALSNTLSPMLSLRHHGCEALCAELAHAARAHHLGAGSREGVEGQRAVDLAGPQLAPPAEELKARLLALCGTLLGALLGEGWEQAAAGQLDGRMCLRVYPASVAPPAALAAPADDGDGLRLGAHCDATLLTLLWASSAGLE